MTERLSVTLPLVLLLLLVLVAGWAYWPGTTGPALLDDRSSVLVIEDLRENPELAWDFIFGDRSGPLGRPVSMASFVLERLFLDGTAATSKKTNIVLHLFNGVLLAWFFWLLFEYIQAPGYRWMAVLLAGGWLLSPLYVSTVLYIVQRMAMLSTTFMLLTCIGYIEWRLKLLGGKVSVILLALTAGSALLAVFAKENAIVVIPVILLVEALWFQFAGPNGQKLVWLERLTQTLIGLGFVGVCAYLMASYSDLANGFERRHFTLEERLLTESRIVWDYAAQIFAPDLFGMGLYHDDVTVSGSIDQPPVTLYALLAWAGLLAILLSSLFWKRGRYLVLGVAWFLVGHSIESTVFPLELYFEHRNYFPGIGLFLLVGVLFSFCVERWPEVRPPLLVIVGCYVAWLLSLTSSQVQIWSSRPLLILHHLNGHPDSFRANADMAVQMASLGQFAAAREFSARAYRVNVTGERGGDHDIRDLALACIANEPVTPLQLQRLGSENPERPFGSVDTLHTLVRMLQDNKCPGFDRLGLADRLVEIFLGEDSPATASANMYLALALLENTLQRWDYANAYVDRFLQMAPADPQGLLMKLHFVSALGKVAEINAVRTTLLQMQEQGQLTVGQQQTLALYLE
ncbi:MAG: hypothetical protein H6992_10735 [Pseudomonadales bacterium]|nr:hypothetical protein [Pseudomonadales bacterium]